MIWLRYPLYRSESHRFDSIGNAFAVSRSMSEVVFVHMIGESKLTTWVKFLFFYKNKTSRSFLFLFQNTNILINTILKYFFPKLLEVWKHNLMIIYVSSFIDIFLRFIFFSILLLYMLWCFDDKKAKRNMLFSYHVISFWFLIILLNTLLCRMLTCISYVKPEAEYIIFIFAVSFVWGLNVLSWFFFVSVLWGNASQSYKMNITRLLVSMA